MKSENDITKDEDGQLWYNGWRLQVIACGEELAPEVPEVWCRCGGPAYLAIPPYEGEYVNWTSIWDCGPALAQAMLPEYRHGFLISHIEHWAEGDGPIQEKILLFEERLDAARKAAWDQYLSVEEV